MTLILHKIILNRRSMSECLKLFDTKTKTIKICFSFLFLFIILCIWDLPAEEIFSANIKDVILSAILD